MLEKRILIIGLCGCILFTTIFVATNDNDFHIMANTRFQLPILIIDAGHGGIDGGTSGADGTLEKTINLSISKKMNQIATLFGYQTIMLRIDDNMVVNREGESIRKQKQADLSARLNTIEKQENCILISVHQNYYKDSKYSGFQVFYTNKNEQNSSLAQSLQTAVSSSLQPNNTRKIKTVGSEIYLLHNCTKPAVMIECGFMSNLQELTLLKNGNYQTKISMVIIESLIKYTNQFYV